MLNLARRLSLVLLHAGSHLRRVTGGDQIPGDVGNGKETLSVSPMEGGGTLNISGVGGGGERRSRRPSAHRPPKAFWGTRGAPTLTLGPTETVLLTP